jgi:hypothetical protein
VTYLQELVEQQPIAERHPPHAWAVDSEPWSGREHRLGRLFAASLRECCGGGARPHRRTPMRKGAARCFCISLPA